MERIEITNGAYAAQWGLTDFYEECGKKLREEYESGKEFVTSWGCKKEIRFVELTKTKDSVFVEVTAEMDDLYDENSPLVYDALWEREHNEREISGELMEEILDEARFYGITDIVSDSVLLKGDASFEDMCTAIEACEDSTEEMLKDMFDRLCNIVENHYKKG